MKNTSERRVSALITERTIRGKTLLPDGTPREIRLFETNGRSEPAIGLVPGWLSPPEAWMVFLDYVAKRDRKAVVVEVLHTRETVASFRSASGDLTDVLQGLKSESIMLVGHSMGCVLAARYASSRADTRVRKVIQVAPPLVRLHGQRVNLLFARASRALPDAFTHSFRSRKAAQWSRRGEDFDVQRVSREGATALRLIKGRKKWYDPAAIPVETRFVVMRGDTWFPPKKVVDRPELYHGAGPRLPLEWLDSGHTPRSSREIIDLAKLLEREAWMIEAAAALPPRSARARRAE